jgi:branched-chain amino acid transport system ATP-binding protein
MTIQDAPPVDCIKATDLRVGYGDLEVVRSVSLHIAPGELVALLGPNGAGKTTLLLALAGFLRPRGGTVELFGQPTSAPAHIRARQGVAYIGDDRNLFPSLTVRQNLRIIKRPPGELLDIFPELKSKLKSRGSLLSGGQQQMLAIGRALITAPKLLIIDELSLGLAPVVTERLLAKLRAVSDAGTAVLIVEQSVRSVLAVADRAYVIGRGELIAHRTSQMWRNSLEELSELFVT